MNSSSQMPANENTGADNTASRTIAGSLDAGADRTERRFFLSRIVLKGAQAFSEAKLGAAYASLLNREIAIAELYAAAEAIAAHYMKAGYALCSASVPAQTITGGSAQINIVEGFIADVQYADLAKAPAGALTKAVRRLTQTRPARTEDLETVLRAAKSLSQPLIKNEFLKIADGERGALRLVLQFGAAAAAQKQGAATSAAPAGTDMRAHIAQGIAKFAAPFSAMIRALDARLESLPYAKSAARGVAVIFIALVLGFAAMRLLNGPSEGQTMTSYGDWRLNCPGAETAGTCTLVQDIADRQTRALITHISVEVTNDILTLAVVVPRNVLLQPGIQIIASVEEPKTAIYQLCTQMGCIAAIELDDALEDMLQEGRAARLVAVNLQGQKQNLNISLRGFEDGLAGFRAAELSRQPWWRRLLPWGMY